MDLERPELESSAPTEEPRGRVRWWVGLVAAIAVLAGAAAGIAKLIDLEQYRVLAERELADATGLPVLITDLDVRLLPTPALRATGVAIGDEVFGGTAATVTVHPSFSRLLEGVLELERIEVHRPAVTLPSEGAEVRARWEAFDEAIKARRRDPGDPPGRIRVDIDTITARDASLTMHDGPYAGAPLLEGEVRVLNPTSDAITVEAKAHALRFGAGARLEGTATLHRVDNRIETVDAAVTAHGIDLGELTDDPDARWLEVALTLSCEAAPFPDLHFAVSGELQAKRGAPETAMPLAGPITGQGWWQDGTLLLNDLTLDAPGVRAVADITRHPDGLFAVLMESVEMRPPAFPLLINRVPADTAAVAPGPDATATARDVYFSFGGDSELLLASLDASFSGWQVDTPRGPVEGLEGAARYEHGVIVIDEVRAEGVAVSGIVTPGDAGTRFELQARAALSPALGAMAGLPEAVTGLSGSMTIDRLEGTTAPGGGIPDDLVIEGTLADGAAALNTGGVEDALDQLSASFRAEGDAIEVDARAASRQMGPLALKGSYTPSKHRWQGTAELDIARAARGFAGDALPEEAGPLLASYGASVFDAWASLPSEQDSQGSVRFARHGAPPLEGTVVFAPGNDENALQSVEIATDLEGAALAAWLPEDARITGGIPVTFRLDGPAGSFAVSADASGAAVDLPPHAHKPAGEPLSVFAEGAAGEGGWSPQRVTASLAGQELHFAPRGDRWTSDSMTLDLARLAPFLKAPVSLSGRLEGMLATNPVEADVRVTEVSVAPSEDARITAVSGRVRVGPDGFAAEDLRIQGAGSDCTVNGGLEGEAWRGDITGRRLDLNAVTAVADAFRALRDEPNETPGPAAPRGPQPRMDGTIALDEVVYRRATLSQVRANLAMRDGILHITDLQCRPGHGAMRGAIEYAFATPSTPARLGLDLAFDEVDTAILDDLSLDPPRGLKGIANARMRLATALPEDGSPLHGMSGEIVFSAVNGSWGRMGMATRVLAVLRTVEVTRLRVPSTQDEGLVYDQSDGRILFEDGFMTLENFELRNATFQAKATGAADWPRDVCDYRIQVMPLESVTGVVSGVPVVGAVAQSVSESGSVYLIADGPATRPNVRLEPGQSINRLRDQIVDSTRGVDERLRDGVGAAGGLIRSLLGN